MEKLLSSDSYQARPLWQPAVLYTVNLYRFCLYRILISNLVLAEYRIQAAVETLCFSRRRGQVAFVQARCLFQIPRTQK
jgi:hypothetical protein